MSAESHEVTNLISLMNAGDDEAFDRIWERFYPALVAYVRRRMTALDRRHFDDEDYALSAMNSFWQGFQKGRFERLNSQDDLWRLMVTIASRKITARRRHNMAHKRGKGAIRGSSALASAGLDKPLANMEVEMQEDFNRLLTLLPDESLRKVALLRLEGFTNSEIAKQIDCAVRTVTRKLDLIRRLWSHEIDDEARFRTTT